MHKLFLSKKHLLLVVLAALLGFFLGNRSPEKKIDFLIGHFSGVAKKNDVWRIFIGIAEEDQPAIIRAVIARVGLGANTNEEALYMSAAEDSHGNPLFSDKKYKITIPAKEYVDEFWSLTVYGENHFLCHNDANKYAVSSFHDLAKKADGTITIYVGQQESEPQSNWLPTSRDTEPISLMFRCYNPTDRMLKTVKSISLPIIEEV